MLRALLKAPEVEARLQQLRARSLAALLEGALLLQFSNNETFSSFCAALCDCVSFSSMEALVSGDACEGHKNEVMGVNILNEGD